MSLYQVPDGFQEDLDRAFQGRLRVRWSHEWDEWHVEQKVRRGLAGFGGHHDDRWRDDLIRYRDGYVWVMSVKQGTRFPCPKCGLTLKAPTRDTQMVSCDHCRLKGYDHYWTACHWPLDQTLIEHLQKLEHEIDDRRDLMQQARTAQAKEQQRRVLEPTLAGFEDNFNLGMGIQSVGYTGRERMWQKDGA